MDGFARARREASRRVVINDALASAQRPVPVTAHAKRFLRAGDQALPSTQLRVAGIAEFPFELGRRAHGRWNLRGDRGGLWRAGRHGRNHPRGLDWRCRTSRPPRSAARAPTCALPRNEQMLGRLEQDGFTYFRQIPRCSQPSPSLRAAAHHRAAHRVGQPAAGRDCRAPRARVLARRVVADVLCESLLIVGIGGLLSLPLGRRWRRGSTASSRRMPGIPGGGVLLRLRAERTRGLTSPLLAVTAIVAALYPMQHRGSSADCRDAARRGDRVMLTRSRNAQRPPHRATGHHRRPT